MGDGTDRDPRAAVGPGGPAAAIPWDMNRQPFGRAAGAASYKIITSGPTDRVLAPVIFLLTGGYAAFAVKRAALDLPGPGPPEAKEKTKS